MLSLDTGYARDYSEGAAYREYFVTDRLMFRVSKTDCRLRNKQEVLVMHLPDRAASDRVPVAIDAQFLRKHPVYGFTVGGEHYVVVTNTSGANRVYRSNATFPDRRQNTAIIDDNGDAWRLTESALVLDRDSTRRLPRVAAQRAFWFGWYAQFPETILIK